MSAHDQDIAVNATQAGSLLGISTPTAARLGRGGKFGAPVIKPGTKRKFYRIAGIEIFAGRRFNPDEISTALAAHNDPVLRPAGVRTAIVGAFLELRDLQWRLALKTRGLDIPAPPKIPLDESKLLRPATSPDTIEADPKPRRGRPPKPKLSPEQLIAAAVASAVDAGERAAAKHNPEITGDRARSVAEQLGLKECPSGILKPTE